MNTANSVLFEENIFSDMIMKNVFETKKLTAYTNSDFIKKYNPDTLKKELDKKKVNVTGFKLSEVWFYNAAWQMSEERIIGVCPLVKDGSKEKMTELFWIYYPELRGIIASDKVSINGADYISNLDDVFLFRYYSGSISTYQKIHMEGKLPKETLVKDDAEQTEMELLDMEHDQWISLTEKK